MDEAIEKAVTQQRAIAQLHFQWMIDQWKYEMGMLEVLGRDEESAWEDSTRRTLRRKVLNENTTPDRPYRFLPFFNGWGVLVRDME